MHRNPHRGDFRGRSTWATRILAIAAGVFLVCLCVGPKLRAQVVTSSMVGTVVDPSGAAVPNATVTLTNTGTNAVRTATTSTTGIFHFSILPAGVYNISVAATGFQTLTNTGIQLTASSTRDLGKLTLQVGSVQQTVTVTAAVTPVQTSSSSLNTSITGSALDALPLKGRSLFGAVDLVPGVVDTNNNRVVTSPNGLGNININGSYAGDSSNVNFTVDGITDVDTGSNGTVHTEPNMGAIQELKVLSNNYSAEYGRTGGGTIEVITKSGTSQYHGQGWWDHRHEQFNANDYFNKKSGLPRSLYRYNVEGWAFGGPVPIPRYNSAHNKLFFFASQEYTGQLATNSPRYVTFPNDDLRGTSAADAACNCILLTQPTTKGTISDYVVNPPGSPLQQYSAYGGTYWGIPNANVDPVGKAMLNWLPDPLFNAADCAVGAYQCNYASDKSDQHGRRNDVIRVDWDPSSKVTSYFRYLNDHDDDSPSWYHFVPWPVMPIDHPNPGHGYMGSFTYIFSPSLIDQVTFGYDWNTWSWYLLPGELAQLAPSNVGNPPLLLPRPTQPSGVNGYTEAMPRFSFGSDLPNTPTINTTSGILQYFNANPIYTAMDDLTWIKGSHQYKFGVYIEHNSKVQPSGNGYVGNYNFGASATNPYDSKVGYVNALLGNYNSFTQTSARAVFDVKYWNVESYAQDSWRIGSRLTLNYGVRMYIQTPQTDANGTFSYFDQATYNALDAPRIYIPACTVGSTVANPCPAVDQRSWDPGLGTPSNPLTAGQVTSATPVAYVGAFVPGSGNPANGMQLAAPLQSTYKMAFPFAAAPRVGFAYDVFGNGKTAIRGGFGIFYSRLDGNQVYNMSGQVPYAYTYAASDGTIATLATTTGVITPGSVNTYSGVTPWLRNYNGSLNVQQNLGYNTVMSVAYAFNYGRDLNLRVNLNPIPLGANFLSANISPVTGKALTQDGSSLERVTYPGYQDVNSETFIGLSNYNALEVTLNHRMTNGLLFGLSYTWSKDMGVNTFDPLVANNNARNYGLLGFDRKQNLQVHWSYDIPGLSSNLRSSVAGKMVGAIVDNWTYSGHFMAQSGAPLGVNLSASGLDITGSGSESARPDVVSNPNSGVPTGMFFNPAAFALPAVGTIGTAGVNPVHSKGLNEWDMTLNKFIPIGLGESRGFNVQFQDYNVFNHTQFDQTGSVTARFNSSGTMTNLSSVAMPTSDVSPRVLAFELNFQF